MKQSISSPRSGTGTLAMKRLAMTLAALLVLATARPAGAWLIGPGACTSTKPDVSTLDPTWKLCSGGCYVILSGLGPNLRVGVIKFKEPDFSGPVHVALVSNDSRLGTSMIQSRKLGELQAADDARLTNWYLPFGGVKASHYYAVVIYGTDSSRSFFRQCFLSKNF
ncbi:MAG: hypothetical protein OXC25_13560 [Thiotrichales bacterium]|nr:hypothetical protein [Thiotrichales bacterium]